MKPLGLALTRLARDLKIPVTRMSEIVNGRRALNADAALRLSRYFGNTPEFWLNLQAAYDLPATIHSSAGRIEREVHPRKACVNLSDEQHEKKGALWLGFGIHGRNI
jgi:addiction module HigA family antidote